MFLSKLFVVDFAARELVQYDKNGKIRILEGRQGRKQTPWRGNYFFSLLCSCGIFRSVE